MERNTVFYLDNDDGTASAILRGASGRWCSVLTQPVEELEGVEILNYEDGVKHFEANKYPNDFLEI